VVAMLWIGLHPAPVLERLRPTSEQVSERMATYEPSAITTIAGNPTGEETP
jgi:hypothetical protein